MLGASILDGWRPDFAETILNSREVEAGERRLGEYLVFLIYSVQ